MAFKILQWNINGYINNYNDLLILIKKHLLKAISLQETHLHSTTNIPVPINYTLYLKNSSQTRYGGVGLLIHKSIEHKQILLADDFDAICLETVSKFKFNIVSAYIDPKHKLNYNQLNNVFGNLVNPSLITGDLNGWHRNWGASVNNKRGHLISKLY